MSHDPTDSKTLYPKAFNHNHATLLVNNIPFAPQFIPNEGSEDQYRIEFNEGYVFDYADGGNRIEVDAEEFTIGETELKQFKLRLTIDKYSGGISKAEILDETSGEGGGGLSDFVNLQNTSEIDGDGEHAAGAEGKEKIDLDLMDLRGPSIKEQYIRENVHLWFRGFAQTGGEGGHAPLKMDPSGEANEIIQFRELREDSKDGNVIEITTDGDSILFYVPEDSCCSDSGSDKSTAIVPMGWHNKGYGALFTMESNEVLFEFVMRNVSLVGSKTVVPIDDRFLAVCEPKSMVITGVAGDRAGSVGAVVEENNVILSAWPFSFLRPTKVTLKLTGVRKGFKSHDMPERSREQFIANENFINSAYPSE